MSVRPSKSDDADGLLLRASTTQVGLAPFREGSSPTCLMLLPIASFAGLACSTGSKLAVIFKNFFEREATFTIS
jgi:hypothetical protein